ncbi:MULTISPECIES: VOC family protein [Bizionia]|uniref:VOC family protein n=1 Tax=Bizionia algoritergicola TaxID=291187 RepID=A0A5D0QVF2_9FLAO|nr:MULTISPECIES: VOC family protein [Bizionia]OBX21509.1 hypothetical protein BAA08_12335 [Bizionia sp. APA-3]TYB72835.1 VOC family protein [Bizionia algoritergicola]
MVIKELTLFTNTIAKQKQFYKSILGLEQLVDSLEKISFKLGSSILTFQYNTNFKTSHMAFNIPSNAIYDALHWLKTRTELIENEGELITNFPDWKAKSIYFYDANNNILEFIAREDLDFESDFAFSANTIVSISEVGIATNDIQKLYQEINSIKPISIFDGDFSRFCALGSHKGLFILVDKNKKTWYPTNDEAMTSDFIITGDYNFSFINHEIKELL